jgi:hypothetical protein
MAAMRRLHWPGPADDIDEQERERTFMQPTDLKLFILEWDGDQELHSLALLVSLPPDGYLLAAADSVLKLHRDLAGGVPRVVIDDQLEREIHQSAGTDPQHGAPDRTAVIRFLLAHAGRFGLDKSPDRLTTAPGPPPGSRKHGWRCFDEQGRWAEYPEHPVEDWRHEVANDETRLGYREWVLSRIDAGDCEPDAPSERASLGIESAQTRNRIAERFWQHVSTSIEGYGNAIELLLRELSDQQLLGVLEMLDADPAEPLADDEPDQCECDSTHQPNDTVCRWCWNRGRRYWNDPQGPQLQDDDAPPTRHGNRPDTPSRRTFYRTLITVEVLAEDSPYKPETLEGVAQDIVNGDCTGAWEVTACEEVDGPRMAELMVRQGSDPEFFGLDEDGNDVHD